ncbi:MAG TPA: exodeoxyribonuclease VII small subunit [Candidatus Saccharimonadales bacterium]|jgi:exodeoxyribonuclease VII small subunit
MTKQSDTFDYRAKAEELEHIVAELQNPDIQIDEATKLHAAGLKLVEELETYLNQAEIIVRKHVASSE